MSGILNPKAVKGDYYLQMKSWDTIDHVETDPRCEKFAQLIYAASGSCTVTLDGERVYIAGSRMLLVDAGAEYSVSGISDGACAHSLSFAVEEGCAAGATLRELYENYESFRQIINKAKPYVPFNDTEGMVSFALKNIGKNSRWESDGGQFYQALNLGKLLLLACKMSLREPDGVKGGNKHVRRAIKFINENYFRDIKVSDIAGDSGIHPCYMHRIFMSDMGVPISQYLLCVRMEKAAVLLVNTNLSMQEIANLTGIKNQQYFGNLFKKWGGVTPTAYRGSHVSEYRGAVGDAG